ncbi:MAG: ABC transporter permease [Anaerolineales bacterium]|nr:ABC transporter permease [Anaerolineales bacterium]MCS7248400.1 ABC transporter permease [Anaerolineales bacterium]MDW8162213.1 ABC transporter permease [Anaerolineales bacterium]MDW8445799.1 ABC transporter permease [Anaerolineales bacterium]
MSRVTPALAYLYALLVLVFLYGPLIVMILMGLNRSPFYELPLQFDLVWFRKLATNERILNATRNSIVLAFGVSLLSTFIGTLAAWAMTRYRFQGRNLLQVLLIPPIAIPWLILAVALLLMFYWLKIPRSLFTLLVGHVGVALPYVILVMMTRFQGLDRTLEEAARSLGASPLVVFLRITLPLILPGLVASVMFTFAVSFDNFTLSHFLAPQGVSTLPVEIYTSIRKGFTPEINAISAIVFFFSAALVVLSSREIKFV